MTHEQRVTAGDEEARNRLEPGMRHAIHTLEHVLNRGQNGAIGAGLAIAIVELKMEIEKL